MRCEMAASKEAELFGYVIIIKRDGDDHTRCPLVKPVFVFGRDEDCDVRILIDEVSGKHAFLKVGDGGKVYLEPSKATDLLLLNGVKITRIVPVSHNDVFTVVERHFRFEYPPGSRHITDTASNTSVRRADVQTSTDHINGSENDSGDSSPVSTGLIFCSMGNECSPELTQQTRKKKVSFGPALSPERFDKRLPPCTPLKKGSVPSSHERWQKSSVLSQKNSSGGLSPLAKSRTPAASTATHNGDRFVGKSDMCSVVSECGSRQQSPFQDVRNSNLGESVGNQSPLDTSSSSLSQSHTCKEHKFVCRYHSELLCGRVIAKATRKSPRLSKSQVPSKPKKVPSFLQGVVCFMCVNENSRSHDEPNATSTPLGTVVESRTRSSLQSSKQTHQTEGNNLPSSSLTGNSSLMQSFELEVPVENISAVEKNSVSLSSLIAEEPYVPPLPGSRFYGRNSKNSGDDGAFDKIAEKVVAGKESCVPVVNLTPLSVNSEEENRRQCSNSVSAESFTSAKKLKPVKKRGTNSLPLSAFKTSLQKSSTHVNKSKRLSSATKHVVSKHNIKVLQNISAPAVGFMLNASEADNSNVSGSIHTDSVIGCLSSESSLQETPKSCQADDSCVEQEGRLTRSASKLISEKVCIESGKKQSVCALQHGVLGEGTTTSLSEEVRSRQSTLPPSDSVVGKPSVSGTKAQALLQSSRKQSSDVGVKSPALPIRKKRTSIKRYKTIVYADPEDALPREQLSTPTEMFPTKIFECRLLKDVPDFLSRAVSVISYTSSEESTTSTLDEEASDRVSNNTVCSASEQSGTQTLESANGHLETDETADLGDVNENLHEGVSYLDSGSSMQMQSVSPSLSVSADHESSSPNLSTSQAVPKSGIQKGNRLITENRSTIKTSFMPRSRRTPSAIITCRLVPITQSLDMLNKDASSVSDTTAHAIGSLGSSTPGQVFGEGSIFLGPECKKPCAKARSSVGKGRMHVTSRDSGARSEHIVQHSENINVVESETESERLPGSILDTAASSLVSVDSTHVIKEGNLSKSHTSLHSHPLGTGTEVHSKLSRKRKRASEKYAEGKRWDHCYAAGLSTTSVSGADTGMHADDHLIFGDVSSAGNSKEQDESVGSYQKKTSHSESLLEVAPLSEDSEGKRKLRKSTSHVSEANSFILTERHSSRNSGAASEIYNSEPISEPTPVCSSTPASSVQKGHLMLLKSGNARPAEKLGEAWSPVRGENDLCSKPVKSVDLSVASKVGARRSLSSCVLSNSDLPGDRDSEKGRMYVICRNSPAVQELQNSGVVVRASKFGSDKGAAKNSPLHSTAEDRTNASLVFTSGNVESHQAETSKSKKADIPSSRQKQERKSVSRSSKKFNISGSKRKLRSNIENSVASSLIEKSDASGASSDKFVSAGKAAKAYIPRAKKSQRKSVLNTSLCPERASSKRKSAALKGSVVCRKLRSRTVLLSDVNQSVKLDMQSGVMCKKPSVDSEKVNADTEMDKAENTGIDPDSVQYTQCGGSAKRMRNLQSRGKAVSLKKSMKVPSQFDEKAPLKNMGQKAYEKSSEVTFVSTRNSKRNVGAVGVDCPSRNTRSRQKFKGAKQLPYVTGGAIRRSLASKRKSILLLNKRKSVQKNSSKKGCCKVTEFLAHGSIKGSGKGTAVARKAVDNKYYDREHLSLSDVAGDAEGGLENALKGSQKMGQQKENTLICQKESCHEDTVSPSGYKKRSRRKSTLVRSGARPHILRSMVSSNVGAKGNPANVKSSVETAKKRHVISKSITKQRSKVRKNKREISKDVSDSVSVPTCALLKDDASNIKRTRSKTGNKLSSNASINRDMETEWKQSKFKKQKTSGSTDTVFNGHVDVNKQVNDSKKVTRTCYRTGKNLGKHSSVSSPLKKKKHERETSSRKQASRACKMHPVKTDKQRKTKESQNSKTKGKENTSKQRATSRKRKSGITKISRKKSGMSNKSLKSSQKKKKKNTRAGKKKA